MKAGGGELDDHGAVYAHSVEIDSTIIRLGLD